MRWIPHPVLVTIRDNDDSFPGPLNIPSLLVITRWGVHLRP